jgi:hypothetical protein
MPATDFLPLTESACSQAGVIYLLLYPPFRHYSYSFDFSRSGREIRRDAFITCLVIRTDCDAGL